MTTERASGISGYSSTGLSALPALLSTPCTRACTGRPTKRQLPYTGDEQLSEILSRTLRLTVDFTITVVDAFEHPPDEVDDQLSQEVFQAVLQDPDSLQRILHVCVLSALDDPISADVADHVTALHAERLDFLAPLKKRFSRRHLARLRRHISAAFHDCFVVAITGAELRERRASERARTAQR